MTETIKGKKKPQIRQKREKRENMRKYEEMLREIGGDKYK